MFKIKHLLIFILPLFFVGLITTKTFARALTSTERKEYAQSNILFYQPCDTEADCERSNANADAADPVDASDPDNPATPDTPGTNPPSGGGHQGDPFTPSGSGAAKIAYTARYIAWPNTDGTCRDSSGKTVGWIPNTSCKDTMRENAKILGINGIIKDCGGFVGQVMRNSVDPNFQKSGVKWQIPYMMKSPNWAKVSTDGQMFSMANLKPGDVLAFSEKGQDGKGHGHIVIWLGNQSVPCGKGSCQINIASSSQGTRTPSLAKLTRMQQCTTNRECFLFQVFRWIGE